MSDWRVKANDIEHLLQLTESHEIFDSTLPSNLKDLKKYQKDVDVRFDLFVFNICNMFNSFTSL